MDEKRTEKGTLYFFTGLAGAGKSTIGGLFYERLKEKRPDAILLDGDRQRSAVGATTERDYSTEARLAGARGKFQSCKALTEQGKDVVCCSICMYDEIRDWNRANIENYREIYLKVSMDTLYRRDQKGLYSSGAKHVVGVDLPWDEPKAPDIIIENDGHEDPETIVDRLVLAFGIRTEQQMYESTSRVRELFAALQDDLSKKVFWTRMHCEYERTLTNFMRLDSLRASNSEEALSKNLHWKEAFETLVRKGEKLVIYGTGTDGQKFGEYLLNDGIDFYAFVGRNGAIAYPNGLLGKPAYSPDWLFEHENEVYVVIATAGDSYSQIWENLRQHEFPEERILPYLQEPGRVPGAARIYFEFPELIPEGIFIDGGCFDGGDSIFYVNQTGRPDAKIIAAEPDPANFAICEQRLNKAGLNNARIVCAGLSDKEGTVAFVAKSTSGSFIVSKKDMEYNVEALQEIHTVRIDDLVGDEKVGFIKMDIEGSEYDALHGAARTIRRDKPLLALSVYHRFGDMLAIMDYCKYLVPEYRFYLRQYSLLGDDTVLYAFV